MHPDIVQFSSKTFYDDTLLSSSCVIHRPKPVWQQKPSFPPIYFWNITDADMKQDASNSFYNQVEKDFIINLLLNLSHIIKRHVEIGVIAFYSSQVKRLRDGIYRMKAGRDFKKSIKVSTVDGFQGGEMDIIILSCVRGLTGDKGELPYHTSFIC